MPSTYSPNLRIELIANGEQSGTWGATTNTNLGTLIEDAISGYVSVTTATANQALTALNGAPDQSRNMLLDLDTAAGSAFNVFVPPVSKMYVVRNNASYAATIYCSTNLGDTTPRGVGVAIPAGKVLIIYTDGTDVYSAINDYPVPWDIVSGGTGRTSINAYNLVCGGVTNTSPVQTVSSGTAGEFLVSNGAGVLPGWGSTLPSNTIATTQVEKTANTTIATTAFVDQLRNLSTPSTSAAGGTAVIGDRGSLITLSAGLTIPSGIFSARDTFSMYNNTSGTLVITQGGGLVLRQVGTANTGNRNLAQRGLATVVFISSTEAVISGGGLT